MLPRFHMCRRQTCAQSCPMAANIAWTNHVTKTPFERVSLADMPSFQPDHVSADYFLYVAVGPSVLRWEHTAKLRDLSPGLR